MINYLEFKKASCKDCYKCLRECPVKAIEVINHQAQIIDGRCILCGKCTFVCPQNAKKVHTEIDSIKQILLEKKVIASVAPSFISSFNIKDFSIMKKALKKLGFYDAEETAIGAREVTAEYKKLLLSGKYKNLITSACPSVNRLIQLYYPEALNYLAPVDSPMIAHAKMIKSKYNDVSTVFIGPCIAKKREAKESGLIEGVLTFDDLNKLFIENSINLNEIEEDLCQQGIINKAKYYPINRGIIKSFDSYVEGYEYVAVDGAIKCKEVLANIESLNNMFLELNTCEYACVNGPCSLIHEGTAVKANADIRIYANKSYAIETEYKKDINVNLYKDYKKLLPTEYIPTEREIKEILAKTGKYKKEDELNCGACGYATCREKAWAVANGYAELDMCVPYMRERAESMSYEIIQNSPNGIVVLDNDINILEINNKALELWGIEEKNLKGKHAFDFFNPLEFVIAYEQGKNIDRKKIRIDKTGKYIELTVVLLKRQQAIFGVLKDITDETNYFNKLTSMKLETLTTTDNVIKKQMRVAQEIASLLGETTAESKVALLKLKKTLLEDTTNIEGNNR